MMKITAKSFLTAFYLLRHDRKKFIETLNNKILISRNSKVTPQDQRTVSQSIEDIIQVIKKNNYSKLVIFSDSTFRTEFVTKFPDANNWKWCSCFASDLVKGASQFLNVSGLESIDAVVVGGKEVKSTYVQSLSFLKRKSLNKPILWVGNDFEFGGSTIPVPSDIDDAEFYLYNHYENFFLSKDPLLVKTLIRDSESEIAKLQILAPNETLHLRLREILPQNKGPISVEFSTTHPVLTRRRHRRWRVWADLFWKGSITSLHGAHDYGPSYKQNFLTQIPFHKSGKVVVTLPNYDLNMSELEKDVTIIQNDVRKIIRRNPALPLEEISIDANSQFSAPPNIEQAIKIQHFGYGENFLYFFEKANDFLKKDNLMANHKASQFIDFQTAYWDDENQSHQLKSIQDLGFMLYPHALPVLPVESMFEYGFSFDSVNPPVTTFRIHCFDKNGRKITDFNFEKKLSGPIFTSEIVKNTKIQDIHLLILEIDLVNTKIDPRKLIMTGDLVVRNKLSYDSDFTEYQSCWRNVGILFKDFPHWIHPSKNLLNRSNLVGRTLNNNQYKTSLLLVNASGNLSYCTVAKVTISVYSLEGRSRATEVTIPAFTFQNIELDKLFSDLQSFLGPTGRGSVHILCSNADLNAQIMTEGLNDSVSLQHLWGY